MYTYMCVCGYIYICMCVCYYISMVGDGGGLGKMKAAAILGFIGGVWTWMGWC